MDLYRTPYLVACFPLIEHAYNVVMVKEARSTMLAERRLLISNEQVQRSLDRDLKDPAYVKDMQERRKQMKAQMAAMGYDLKRK